MFRYGYHGKLVKTQDGRHTHDATVFVPAKAMVTSATQAGGIAKGSKIIIE